MATTIVLSMIELSDAIRSCSVRPSNLAVPDKSRCRHQEDSHQPATVNMQNERLEDYTSQRSEHSARPYNTRQGIYVPASRIKMLVLLLCIRLSIKHATCQNPSGVHCCVFKNEVFTLPRLPNGL
jgi:hypothetical protein